ncbi:zinc-ribbon domain-containing protein [Microbulbifer sp. CnH-101-G]|uniref:zinc-ribbon domain-containing protein n=1 Tax=Microbulbifer sp. CnH-101-G TaxID=3243393 RepID=UPI004039667C
MSNNSNTRNYVDHPRYGKSPIPSENSFSSEEIERSHWRYGNVKFFPETAILANIDKQDYAIYPRKMYVDIEEQCEVCKRPFIFFAKEQKYWFEELHFYVDAHCTRCIDCRKKDQEIKRLQTSYCELVSKGKHTSEESNKLKNIALELLQLGIIKDKSKIDRIS